MIPIIFSTGSLYTYSIERCFQFAAEAGCDGLELMVDERWETRQVDYLKGLMTRYGQPIRAVHNPFDRAKLRGWPEAKSGRITCSIELAEALGARTVIHHLPTKRDLMIITTRGKRLLLPWFGSLQRDYRQWILNGYTDLQAKTDVLLCMENMPTRRFLGRNIQAHHWNTPTEMGELPALQHITLDTTHLGTWGIDAVDVYEQFQGKVQHIHFSNFDGREHRRPETGQLNLGGLLQKLDATAYQGAVSLELHPDALDEGQPDEHIIGLLQGSVKFCRQHIT